MKQHDESLEKELELMNQVDWSKVLSIPDHLKNQTENRVNIPKEGDKLEDFL